MLKKSLLGIIFSLLLTVAIPKSVFANSLVVNSVGDEADANTVDGVCLTSVGTCTLRAAITQANANSGADTITFNIPGSGIHTINIASSLPELTDQSGPTTIDGYSQPGSLVNSDQYAQKANLTIEVSGPGYTTTGVVGFRITSPNNVIKGLAIDNIFNPIDLDSGNCHDNKIIGNFIGTDPTGTKHSTTGVADAYGVRIEMGAKYNFIGDGTVAGRNVVSGNSSTGVWFVHPNTNNNQILNNIIGLSPLGDRRLPNNHYGVDLNSGPSFNVIKNNVVSGNFETGMEISHLVPSTNGPTQGNHFESNFVGTDLTGNSAPAYTANGWSGIRLKDGVSNNYVVNNVVGNNNSLNSSANGGISIGYEPGRGWALVTGSQVSGNRVGVSLNGTSIPNHGYGLAVFGATNSIGPNNIIANNSGVGVGVYGASSDFNTIVDNTIYNNAGLGIDLEMDGVTPNDVNDADTGANQDLNFPVLTSVTTASASGTACSGCKVQLFTAAADPTGYGEGQRKLKTTTADSNGNFTVPFAFTITTGTPVTATATDPQGNTSEFSLNVAAK